MRRPSCSEQQAESNMSDAWVCFLLPFITAAKAMWDWWRGGLTGSLSHVWVTLSHPPVPFSSAPANRSRVKSPSKRKLIKSGSGRGRLEQPQSIFCRFPLSRWWGAGSRERGRTERLQGWREMWMEGFREREASLLKFHWGPSLRQHHGPFSGSAALRPQRGYFSFIYSISCHVDPKAAPVSLPNCPVFLAAPNPLLQKNTSQRQCCESVVVFLLCNKG